MNEVLFKTRNSKKAQARVVYLFFLLIMLIPVLVYLVPTIAFQGSIGVTSSGASGLTGFIMDNLMIIIGGAFILFIILWQFRF